MPTHEPEPDLTPASGQAFRLGHAIERPNRQSGGSEGQHGFAPTGVASRSTRRTFATSASNGLAPR